MSPPASFKIDAEKRDALMTLAELTGQAILVRSA
jgi:hypothetical protein